MPQPALIAIRHTPVQCGEGLCYGSSDLPVPADEVAAAARRLRAELPDWPIVSSPLSRARHLAEAVDGLANERSAVRGVQLDARLSELHFGRWELQRWDQIDRGALDAWASDPAGFRMPDGERFLDLQARVCTALAELRKPTLWFTHAGVIRALHYLRGGVALEEALHMPIPHAVAVNF